MDRRSFFKFLSASVVVAYAPNIVLASVKKNAPLSAAEILRELGGKEYGISVLMPGPYSQFFDWTSEFLIEDAKKHMPRGATVELRACMPMDYGRAHQAAWYTNSKIAISAPTGLHPLEVNRHGGYFSAGSVRL